MQQSVDKLVEISKGSQLKIFETDFSSPWLLLRMRATERFRSPLTSPGRLGGYADMNSTLAPAPCLSLSRTSQTPPAERVAW